MTNNALTDTKQVAVIYARVSSTKQLRDGDGLASQETRCREFADYKGYDVVRVFKDDISGKFKKRPDMDAMLAFLRKHRNQRLVVIIDDISRLARGLEAHLHLRASIAKAGGQLESPSIEFGDNPDSRMFENIRATFAGHQREKNREQTVNRMRSRMMNGYWAFYPPVGYHYEKVEGHGKLLVPYEPDASIIREAFEGYATGRFASASELKRCFERTDVLSKDKNGEVHLSRIQELLDRSIYAGYIDYEPWGLSLIKGQHQALISLETWQSLQDKRKECASAPARKDINTDFPLRGFVACADCGKPYTACWSKGRKKHYPYYLCDTKGCPNHRKSVPREKIEDEFGTMLKTMAPSRDLFELSLAIFQEIWNQH
ncbi:MAG: recombinase family protein [Pseudomonadota bacterium]